MKILSHLIEEAIPKIKEIINDDWELMELNPGKPYRNGMKEVHFIKLKVLFETELTNIVKESFKNTRVEEKPVILGDITEENQLEKTLQLGRNQALEEVKNVKNQFLNN